MIHSICVDHGSGGGGPLLLQLEGLLRFLTSNHLLLMSCVGDFVLAHRRRIPTARPQAEGWSHRQQRCVTLDAAGGCLRRHLFELFDGLGRLLVVLEVGAVDLGVLGDKVCLVAEGFLRRGAVHERLVELFESVVAHGLALQLADQGLLFLLVQLHDGVVALLLQLEKHLRVFCSKSVSRTSKEKFLIILAELSCQVLVRHQRVLFIIVGVVCSQITAVNDCWNHRSRVPHPLLPCKLLIALLCV